MDNKNERIYIRVTEKDKILLSKLAKYYNMSLSKFIRTLVQSRAKELLQKELGVGKGSI